MKQDIAGINLVFGDGEKIYIESNLFSNLYISNIDNEANEIPYEKLLNTNFLYANFFIIKINHLINDLYNSNILKSIYSKKDLAQIELKFNNNNSVNFCIASKNDPFTKKNLNTYDQTFFQDNDLCVLVCPYNLKYSNNLFA